MGRVQCIFKIMPESDETELEELKEKVKDAVEVDDIQEEEVAFGLKAVKISTITDEEGGIDQTEETLSGIDEVQSVELEHFDRL